MVDWPGFMKWSINFHDNTKQTEIDSLTQEQKKFLEDAISSFTFDEVKRMQEILTIFKKDITDKEKVDQNLDLLEELIELLASIDNAKNFCKIGGVYQILEYSLNKNLNPILRQMSLSILVDCSQNNSFVQSHLRQIEFWRLLDIFSEKDLNWKMKLRTVGAIGAMVKGNNIINKRDFLKNNGFDILVDLIFENLNEKNKDKNYLNTFMKIFNIFDDILKFEKYLDKDCALVNNDSELKTMKKKKEFKHFTRFTLKYIKELTNLFEQVGIIFLNNLEYKTHNHRITFMRTLVSFLHTNKKKCIKKSSLNKIRNILSDYEDKLRNAVKDDDLYQSEIVQLIELKQNF